MNHRDSSVDYDFNGSRWLFRLYITGQSAKTKRIVSSIKTILNKCLSHPFEIDVVDIMEYPLTAISDRVVTTPTLLRLLPPPVIWVTGDLNDEALVAERLGLRNCREQ